MALSCGLDFGTSNSTLGRVGADGHPDLLALEDGSRTIPSVLFFNFEDDRLYFGRAAVAEYVSGADGRLMRSLKSVLGTALFGDTTRVKARRLGFGEIIGSFVGELKRRAEAELGGELTQVVMGRPVHFVDDDPVADAEARESIGPGRNGMVRASLLSAGRIVGAWTHSAAAGRHTDAPVAELFGARGLNSAEDLNRAADLNGAADQNSAEDQNGAADQDSAEDQNGAADQDSVAEALQRYRDFVSA